MVVCLFFCRQLCLHQHAHTTAATQHRLSNHYNKITKTVQIMLALDSVPFILQVIWCWWWCYPTPSERERGRREIPWRPNSWATPQGLDQNWEATGRMDPSGTLPRHFGPSLGRGAGTSTPQ